MTTKAHTYYIIFGRPPIGGKLLALPSLGDATAVDDPIVPGRRRAREGDSTQRSAYIPGLTGELRRFAPTE